MPIWLTRVLRVASRHRPLPNTTFMSKKIKIYLWALLLCSLPGHSIADIELFPLSSVRLQDGPFKHAEQTNLKYLLAMDPDRLLAPYRRESGLPSNVASYGNWESSGLDGHIGGHYLTALALMYASTGEEILLKRLNYMIDELKKCQDKNGNGYLGGIPDGEVAWKALSKGHIKVDNFSLNDKWVPWYNLHKTFAGLRDAYQYAGNDTAKTMLIQLSDWALKITNPLSDQQMEAMLRGEHGGMSEIFVDVAEITGDKKYLTLAKRFAHRQLLNPLLQGRDELTGLHANTQIPKVIGFKRIADMTHDQKWNDAAQFFWETVVTKRSVAIGGNSVKEHFHPSDDFQPMVEDIEGPETCNTYNMLKLSKLFMNPRTILSTWIFMSEVYTTIFCLLNIQPPAAWFISRLYARITIGFILRSIKPCGVASVRESKIMVNTVN